MQTILGLQKRKRDICGEDVLDNMYTSEPKQAELGELSKTTNAD